MKKGYLVFGMVMVILSIFAFAIMANFNVLPSSDVQVSNPQGGFDFEVSACSQVIRADGTIEYGECFHNVFTDAGKDAFQDIIETGTSYGNFTTMGLCNQSVGCAPEAGDTTIDDVFTSCGMEMIGGTSGDIGIGNVSIWHTWTATCDDIVTNMTGLVNQTGAGYLLLSAIPITTATLQTDDQLLVNITATFT